MACHAICSTFFVPDEDGKVALVKNGVKALYKDGVASIEVDKLDCAEDAANACPTGAIKVEK